MKREHAGGHRLMTSVSDVTCVTSSDNNAMATRHTWDIADSVFPTIDVHDSFVEYPVGYVKYAYSGDCVEAMTHQSGWAARNANNHNQAILKKSCLGVLLCDGQCQSEDGKDIVRVRPSICDKARRKQINKPCATKGCTGRLRLRPCRGHGGYPVTHFWREVPGRPGTILFQAKGEHDHPAPERKSSTTRGLTRLKENRKPIRKPGTFGKMRQRRGVAMTTQRQQIKPQLSPVPYHNDVTDKQPFIPTVIDTLQSEVGMESRWMTSCNNTGHVTSSLTNHNSPYEPRLLLDGQSAPTQFPVNNNNNYVTDHVGWNHSDQQVTQHFTRQQFPVAPPLFSGGDVTSGVGRAGCYDGFRDTGVVYPVTWPTDMCATHVAMYPDSRRQIYSTSGDPMTSYQWYRASTWRDEQHVFTADQRRHRHVVCDVTFGSGPVTWPTDRPETVIGDDVIKADEGFELIADIFGRRSRPSNSDSLICNAAFC